MMFFQALLPAGYLYAHLATKRGPSRRRAWVHLAVLAAAAASFPIRAVPPDIAHPILRLLAVLTLSVGAPFFALSSTVPTLQAWLAASGRPERENPYVLYAASNAGALAGLLAYPFVIERLLPLHAQLWVWQACYAVFVLSHLLCLPGADVLLSPVPEGPGGPEGTGVRPAPPAPPAPSPRQVLSWVILSAGPCAAMLASTHFLTSSLAAVPLLWVAPLGIYLATFIVNFKSRPWRPENFGCAVVLVAAITLGPLAAVLVGQRVLANGMSFISVVGALGVVLNFAALFVVAMICHRSLAESRPAEDGGASVFYLAVSAGGLLGGVLLGLFVPVLGRHVGWVGLDWMVAGLLSLGALFVRDWDLWRARNVVRPLTVATGFVLVLAVLIMARGRPDPGSYVLRNFYGVYRVEEAGPFRRLMHGNTLHGLQFLDPAKALQPLSYYHRLGPVGDIYRLFGARIKDLGAVGLGAGAVACYGRPGEAITFYELDPDVETIARERFSFLDRTPAAVRVVIGDARLSMEAAKGPTHDLLIIDAFNGGAIPTHLLTKEAFALYLRRTSPGGIILVHISNRFLDLRPVLAAVTLDLGLHAAVRHAKPTREQAPEFYMSRWVAVSQDADTVRRLEEDPEWRDISQWRTRLVKAWTDRYTSILPILRF
ncbi:MAG: fused MFS/spermidine synthase [Elusimicrobia bacterium]|nr:fused MFS/spermidine synthase [Elusimicrobiota bacterium]